MNDMSPVIIPKSDQINADSLIAGPMTVTIKDVQISAGDEQPVSIILEETKLLYRPCKSMSRVLVGAWGPDAKKYIGRTLRLYRDPDVQWGGMKVGGIRISHMSHITEKKTMALTATRSKRAPFTVLPLKDAPAAPQTKTEDPARKWANGFIAKLPTLTDAAALSAFEAEKAAKLTELQSKKPDLYANVMAKLTARKAELTPSDDSFDDDLTADAPAAEPTSDLSGEADVNARISELEAAPDAEAVEAIIKAAEKHLPFLEERLQMKLEIAFDQARQRVKVEEPAQ